eukprot:TRINITY_DN16371_c0_g1_i1.p1 TRINITY_DN16371_c0_g1~~TRINITY_DN16371_c0_g1_i1.p1  ORF type:complete len:988 (-),score=221.17 TRINITY_DN16371_c0_g1_i1:10-2745(-)
MSFEVVPQPLLSRISPVGGVTNSSDLVMTLFGSFFGVSETPISVIFGTVGCPVVAGSLECSLDQLLCLIECLLPLGAGSALLPGELSVRLLRHTAVATAPSSFLVALQHRIAAVVPQGGEVGRQVTIEISPNDAGNGPEEWQVFLGTVSASFFSFDSINTRITISIPDPTGGTGVVSGTYPLSVVRFGYVTASNIVEFGFVPSPVILSISPRGGNAGTLLTVTGARIVAGTSAENVQVLIGGQVCTAPVLSFPSANVSEVVCGIPSLVPGIHDVFLSAFGIVSDRSSVRFQSVETPVFITVSPQGGPADGSVVLTVEGQYFGNQEDILSVSVGGRACPLVGGSLNSAGNRLLCVASGVGAEEFDLPVSISVYDVVSLSTTGSPGVSFVPRPLLFSISPLGGTPGSVLTLSGQNFGSDEDQLSVRITDASGAIESACVVVPNSLESSAADGASQVKCTLPSLPAGSSSAVLIATVVLYNTETLSATLSAGSALTIFALPPTVSSLEPRFARRGDWVVLRGAGFSVASVPSNTSISAEAIVISVGNEKCRAIADLTASQLRFQIPEGAANGMSEISASFFGVGATVPKEATLLIYEAPQFVRWNSGIAVTYAVFLALFALVIFAVIAGYVYMRDEPVIRRQQPLFCVLTLLGCVMAIFAVMPFVGKPTATTCAARMWVPPIAFTMLYGALFAKTWRIYRIFNNPSLKAIVITNVDLAVKIGFLLGVDLVLVALWFAAAKVEPALAFRDSTVYATCQLNGGSVYPALLLAFKIGLLIFGAVLAFQTRTVRSSFNESKYIAFTLYNQLFVVLLVSPIFVAVSDPQLDFAVIFIGDFIIVAATVGILFIRTLVILWFGEIQTESDPAGTSSAATLSVRATSRHNLVAGTQTAVPLHTMGDSSTHQLAWEPAPGAQA